MALVGSAQSLPVLLVPADAASLGTAGTGLAGEVLSSAVENNASALVFAPQKMLAGVSYGMWKPSAGSLISGGGWWNGGKWAAGFQLKSLSSGSYIPTSENGVASQIDDPFSPSDLSIALGGAFRIGSSLSAGVTLQMVSSSLGKDYKAFTVNASVSATYDNGPLRAGLAVQNLGAPITYAEDVKSPQPMLVSAGASYRIIPGLRAQLQADYLFSGAFMAGVGAEYAWKDMLLVRAAYHLNTGALGPASYASAGLGVRFAGVRLDVAYVPWGETLGQTLMFTLGYGF